MKGMAIGIVVLIGWAAPASAEMIRWGYGGSIFGGGTWEVRPDDTVIYRAYQAEGAVTARKEWVWENEDAKLGHITFAITGAYGVASGIVTAGIRDAGLGPAVPYQSDCADAGFFTFEVEIEGFDYTAQLDNCIPHADDVPAAALAQYQALRAVAADIRVALRLDGVLDP
jgi:hypothetical protein